VIRFPKSKWTYAGALLLMVLGIWAAVYYTGDQEGKVAWSASFSIDTTDPDSLTKAVSIAVAEDSAYFTIDTQDPDSVTRALAIRTTEESTFFTIDTRDPDSLVFATSTRVSETSGYFTIDTMASGTTYVMWGDFTIDTRDPDSLVFATSTRVSEWSAYFTIDTRKPPPQDSDADELHDLWEGLYFGSLFLYGPDDDPDHDGLSNYFEFATGTDPTKANAAASVAFWVESSEAGPRLFLRYPRHILASRMVRIEVMMSDELKSWIDQSQRWEEYSEVMAGNGYLEWITLIYPLTGEPPPSQFLQLRLSTWGADPGL
jgi:hypothetical protein